MTETIILEDYPTAKQYSTRRKRHSLRKLFHWKTEKSHSDFQTVEKINLLYKNNNVTSNQADGALTTTSNRFKKFLFFPKKQQHNITTNLNEVDTVAKGNSLKSSFKRTLNKLKSKKLEKNNEKECSLAKNDAENFSRDALECYNKFTSNTVSSANKHNTSTSIKDLNFDVNLFKIGKGSLKKLNSLKSKQSSIYIGGEDPATNLDPFSPLTGDTNTLLKPFKEITFEKDDVFDKENSIEHPQLRVGKKAKVCNKNKKEEIQIKGFNKNNIQALLFGKQNNNSLTGDITALTVNAPSFYKKNVLNLTDVKQSPQFPSSLYHEASNNDEMNSSETLKEIESLQEDCLNLEFVKVNKNSRCSNTDYEAKVQTNVKCLAIPTFRDDNTIALEDYVKGHQSGRLTQLEILESMQNQNISETQMMEKIKDTFDDFRNPSFYTGNSEDNRKYYTCDNTYDTSSVNQTIRSIGTSKNKDSSKIKFNLLSEVFYYDKTAESKGNKNLSILETVKKQEDAVKQDDSLLLPKNNDNLFLNSNSTEVVATEACNNLDFAKLDNTKRLLNIRSVNNDKITITNHYNNNSNSNKCCHYENSDLSLDTLKRIAMNLPSDEALEYLSQYEFPYKNQMINNLETDGCLADIESLESPNLTFSENEEILPINFFSVLFPSLENQELKRSTNTISNMNNDILKLSSDIQTKQKDGETTSIRSILKKKVNKNETIELQSLFSNKNQDDINEETTQLSDSNLQKMRIDQLRRFYSSDFYPDLENDEDYVRSLKSTQSKYNGDLYT